MWNEHLTNYLETRFDVEKITNEVIQWIQDWFAQNGPTSPAIIGLSGGKDSTVVATLCTKALGKERVFGVLMPDHIQSDFDVAKSVAEWLGIKHGVVDIGAATDGIKQSLQAVKMYSTENESLSEKFAKTPQMLTNIPPRVRMTTLYAIAQSMNGRVSNNCNRSEDYVGYSTIFGDAAGDFSPLSHLTVAEVITIGEYLGVPEEFIRKKPSDGLTGKTDEDNFGFTYEALDTYILTGICEDEGVKELIDKKHKWNLFKLEPMAAYRPETPV